MVQKIIRYKPFKHFWKETKIELEEKLEDIDTIAKGLDWLNERKD